MSDIWDNVATSLREQVDFALFELRQHPQFERMGSEIERAFAAHFALGAKLRGGFAVHIGMPSEPVDGFVLAPQVEIGMYRVDFVFVKGALIGRRDKWIVIECDGHDFHDKTKEQAARDKARDRFLSANVARVLRFTGSEIYRDVGGCWADVAKVMNIVYPPGEE